VLLIVAVNLVVCRRLLITEYLDQMGSIEAAYIGLSRWILARPDQLDWFPLWYGGIPFQNTYPPVLHFLVAGAAAMFSVSPARAHHLAGGLAYVLGPVSLYWMARALSGDRIRSLVAALVYSLLAPSALLVPAIAHDMGTAFGPRRLHVLVVYGEGPHVLSLALLPLAVLALHRALERFRPMRVLAAAVALALVPLTNWLGGFALAVAVAAYLAAQAERLRLQGLLRAAAVGVLAYCLAAPWIPPSTLAAIRRNAQYTVGHYPMTAWQALGGGLLLVVAAGIWVALRKRGASPFLIFASLFATVMGAIALAGHWFGKHLVPQPERYHLEMDMGLVLLAVFAAGEVRHRIPERLRQVLVLAGGAGALVLTGYGAHEAGNWIRPARIAEKVEYQVARWLEENLPGRRVFATGSIKFWLNAFADNPQLGGGFDQGIANPMIPKVTFGIPFTQGDGERCARWLRACGIDAIVVSGPATADAYRDYRDAGKFEGVLRPLWRRGDDVIYEVPRRNPALAHVIPRQAVVGRAPLNIEDEDPIRDYHAAIEDPGLPAARLEWRGTGQAAVEAVVAPDEVISVQISYHPGWRASVNGRAARLAADGLGWIVVEPGCGGPCRVELVWDGGLEMKIARGARALALGALLAWFAAAWLRRRMARRPSFS
jgi:hypothetical protein